MCVKGASGEASSGSERHAFGPCGSDLCYRVTENLSKLCYDVGRTAEPMNNDSDWIYMKSFI